MDGKVVVGTFVGASLAYVLTRTAPTPEQVAHEGCDYIVIGGGSAGCVMASRLSENPQNRVVLLESGPPDSSLYIQLPALWPEIHVDKSLAEKYDWGYWTTSQPGTGNPLWKRGDKWIYPRGKVMGGCSSTNAMVYIRGNAADFNRWAEMIGDESWSYEKVLPYFRKSEDNDRGASAYHGAGGLLKVTSPDINPITKDFLEAAKKAGETVNPDHNAASQFGFGPLQLTIGNGYRSSTARAFIAPVVGRKNLKVLTNCHVNKILFQGNRTIGVEFVHEKKVVQLFCQKEVVLSAGAINSPQILMLSGIGPKEHLSQFNVPVLVDLPGVGANLQDHVNVFHMFESKEPITYDKQNVNVVSAAANWVARGKGPISTSGLEASGFIRAVEPTQEFDQKHLQPDVQVHFSPSGTFEEISARYGLPLPKDPGYPAHLIENGFAKKFEDKKASCFIAIHTLLHYKSKGSVRLQSNNPSDAPLIDPQFLQDDEDLDPFVESVERVRKIAQKMKYAAQEVQPGAHITDKKELREYAKQFSWTCYHPAGTCKMGRKEDSLAVVDSQLRVRGVYGLRVVDASVMPEVTSGNTNAPVIMIAEKAADLILTTIPSKL